MTFIAGSVVVNGVGEKCVEAEANQKWFADLNQKKVTSELE